MSRRVVIVTEIIAPYRIPVFNALAQRPEIDLHVIFLAETDPTLRQWKVYSDEIRFSYEVLASWRRRLGAYNLLLNWGTASALRNSRPDAVICGGYSYLASWSALTWARQHQTPFACWVESTAADQRRNHPVTELLKSRFLDSCNAFVVPGKASFEYLCGYGAAPQTIFTAPNAVDTAKFSRLAGIARSQASSVRQHLGLPQRFFLFVGRLVRDKGVFHLVQAFAKFRRSSGNDIALVLVGDGADSRELREFASGLASGAIYFTGFVQREQLPAYYALADALVFPTLSDTWGLVLNEAMACGVPVIASSVAGATSDLVHDGWNGCVVEAGNADQLTRAMTQIAGDPELRATMGQRSREQIQAFTPQRCAAGIATAATSRWMS